MRLLSRSEIQGYAGACLSASGAAAEASGFVPMRALLRRFGAEVHFRPLLVEAMLCETNESEPRWKLLVDSDQYKITQDQIERETLGSALPDRLRNTIAHELTHSLAFRLDEFGVTLTAGKKLDVVNSADHVAEIERHTEELSPLLLVPDKSIDAAFPANNGSLSMRDIVRARNRFAVSRFVLVSRLNLLRVYGNTRLAERNCFQNLALLIGKWSREGQPVLLHRPIYERFENNVAPEFIHKLKARDSTPLTEVVPNFDANGEANFESPVVVDVRAGTFLNPALGEMHISVSIEHKPQRRGTFFVLVKVEREA